MHVKIIVSVCMCVPQLKGMLSVIEIKHIKQRRFQALKLRC